MPVYKFRSVEAMNQPRWRTPGDPALYQAMAAVWETARRTSKTRLPPGVRRYRSIEDMDAAFEAWRRQVTLTKGNLHETDRLNREYWASVDPRERLAQVWDLVLEHIAWRTPDAGEPRLQRSVLRIERR